MDAPAQFQVFMCGVNFRHMFFNFFFLFQEPVKPVDLFDYDVLATNILQSGKFRNFLAEIHSENRKTGQLQIEDMIQISFNDLIYRLNQDLAKTEEKMVNYQTLQQEYIEKIQQDKSNLEAEIKNVIQNFQSILESNPNQADILELKTKLETAQTDMEALMILVKKCCNQKLVIDHDAILKQFENQFVTNEQFQAEKARILTTVQERLLEASKRSLNDLIDGKLVTLIRPNMNETSEISNGQLTKFDVEDLVNSALLTYGADKTGSFDFALETGNKDSIL